MKRISRTRRERRKHKKVLLNIFPWISLEDICDEKEYVEWKKFHFSKRLSHFLRRGDEEFFDALCQQGEVSKISSLPSSFAQTIDHLKVLSSIILNVRADSFKCFSYAKFAYFMSGVVRSKRSLKCV